VERLEAEHDNLRAALTWSLETPANAETALRLVAALHWFWYLRGHLSEGQRWLEAALTLSSGNVPAEARASALTAESHLAIRQDNDHVTRDRRPRSFALGRALRNAAGVADALDSLGMGDLFQINPGELRPLVEESVVLYRNAGDQRGLATALCTLGMVAIVSSEPEAAVSPLTEGVTLWRALGDSWGLARALHYAGELARLRGDNDQSRSLYEESLHLYQAMDHTGMAAIILHNLGYIAQRQGNPQHALAYFAQALAEHVKSDDRHNVACCLGGIAGVVAALGRQEQGARLFGVVDMLFERLGASIWPVDKIDYDRNLESVRVSLREDAFAAAFATGRALTVEDALAEATTLAAMAGDTTVAPASDGAFAGEDAGATVELTPRERQILGLMAWRATDREIAEQLAISPRTVMHHVSHILAKLGASNRRDAAAIGSRYGLP
jgi:non-specific serine/threonine protein kinase